MCAVGTLLQGNAVEGPLVDRLTSLCFEVFCLSARIALSSRPAQLRNPAPLSREITKRCRISFAGFCDRPLADTWGGAATNSKAEGALLWRLAPPLTLTCIALRFVLINGLSTTPLLLISASHSSSSDHSQLHFHSCNRS